MHMNYHPTQNNAHAMYDTYPTRSLWISISCFSFNRFQLYKTQWKCVIVNGGLILQWCIARQRQINQRIAENSNSASKLP